MWVSAQPILRGGVLQRPVPDLLYRVPLRSSIVFVTDSVSDSLACCGSGKVVRRVRRMRIGHTHREWASGAPEVLIPEVSGCPLSNPRAPFVTHRALPRRARLVLTRLPTTGGETSSGIGTVHNHRPLRNCISSTDGRKRRTFTVGGRRDFNVFSFMARSAST